VEDQKVVKAFYDFKKPKKTCKEWQVISKEELA